MHLLQQAAADSCFASSYFAGKQDKTAVTFKTIYKVSHGFAVLFAHIKIARVRCNRKWHFQKTKKFFIHRRYRIIFRVIQESRKIQLFTLPLMEGCLTTALMIKYAILS